MKKWIFYAVIFTVVGFAFPLLSGDGAKAGSALVSGVGVIFVVIVLYLIQLGWTKFFGIFKPKLVHQQDAAYASPISVRLEPMSQPVPPTQFPTPSPIQKTRDVANVDMDDDAIYTIVAEELESGKTDKGLWTRLFAECKGDEKQVKALYITRRVEKIMEAEKNKKQLLQKQETASLEQKTLQATAEGGSARSEKNTLINIETKVKKRVWPKVLGGLVLVVVAGVGSAAYYQWDQQRVKPATGLNGIELSMRQEEVTARFGRQPDCPITKTENEIKMSFMTSSFARELSGGVGINCDVRVTLENNSDGIYRTARICKTDGYIPKLGWDESSVLEQLGKPDSESFSADGTLKVSNFKKYNLSLTFSGGKPHEICVMRDPNLVFTNAFKPG